MMTTFELPRGGTRWTFLAVDFLDERGNNFASRPVPFAFPSYARPEWSPPVVGSFAGTDALRPVGTFDSRWPNLSTIFDG